MRKLDEYYDLTIRGYGEGDYEVVPPEDFPKWESFLVPYLRDGDHILDFGCGTGVYARRFERLGYRVSGVDGSEVLCKTARERIGGDVRCMRFGELEDVGLYDAVFACVSILHVSRRDYPDIFRRVYRALRGEGHFYVSFKEGEFDGFRDETGSYFCEMTEGLMSRLLEELGLFRVILVGRTRYQNKRDEHWIHFVLEKI